MDIRWDWLQPLITAPYVPALGPVHPACLTPGLFADVLAVAGTGRFVPYDKDRRWSNRKDEHVIVRDIVQQPGLVLIPAFSTRRQRLRVHVYSQNPHSATGQPAQLARRLSSEHRAARGQVTSFGPFAEQMAGDGFAFLHDRLRQQAMGPVLTVQRDGKVAGAIGPMETGTDSQGQPVPLPQYFGVLPEYRGLGLGRQLWQAAMHWGQQRNARYQLLQARAGSTADSLHRSEALTDLVRYLGLICTSTT